MNSKPPIENKNLIIKGAGTNQAFLKKVSGRKVAESGEILIKESPDFENRPSFNPVQGSDLEYTIPQQNEKFELWITEVNYGYGINGQFATSRLYNKFYPQYFTKNPIQVKGICKDEVEYNKLATFIRQQQVNVTIDYNNLFVLEIPAAAIRCFGVVDNFVAGVSSEDVGIPVAPEFNFNFIVFRDLNDPKDSILTESKASFSTLYNRDRNIIINDDAQLPAIFSTKAIGGDVKPQVPKTVPKYSEWLGKRKSTPRLATQWRRLRAINNGTNGAKGS